MVLVSSLVFPLADRLREIDAALAECADEARRKGLLAEREIKHALQLDLLAAARPIPRKRAKQ
jgi:hypothetical protein